MKYFLRNGRVTKGVLGVYFLALIWFPNSGKSAVSSKATVDHLSSPSFFLRYMLPLFSKVVYAFVFRLTKILPITTGVFLNGLMPALPIIMGRCVDIKKLIKLMGLG